MEVDFEGESDAELDVELGDVAGADNDEDEDDIEESDTETEDEGDEYDPELFKNDKTAEPVSGPELRDLVKLMKCPKDGAEILAAFLKKKSFLKKGVKVTQFRKRNENFKKLFDWDADGTFVYCTNINRLFSEMYQTTHNPAQWRLFIDGSVKSLKVC